MTHLANLPALIACAVLFVALTWFHEASPTRVMLRHARNAAFAVMLVSLACNLIVFARAS